MHVHFHGGNDRTSRILRISLFVTAAYIALLVVTGIRAHSLALLSEAGHNLTDFVALLLSLFAVYLHSRPPSATHTYGYQRAGVLAALVNARSFMSASSLLIRDLRVGLKNKLIFSHAANPTGCSPLPRVSPIPYRVDPY